MWRRSNWNNHTIPTLGFAETFAAFHRSLAQGWYEAAREIDRVCRQGEVNAQEGAQLQQLKWHTCLMQLRAEYRQGVETGQGAYSVSFSQRLPYLRGIYCVNLRIERINCHISDDARSEPNYDRQYETAQLLASDYVQGIRECERVRNKIQTHLQIDGYTEGAYDQLQADLIEVNTTRHLFQQTWEACLQFYRNWGIPIDAFVSEFESENPAFMYDTDSTEYYSTSQSGSETMSPNGSEAGN